VRSCRSSSTARSTAPSQRARALGRSDGKTLELIEVRMAKRLRDNLAIGGKGGEVDLFEVTAQRTLLLWIKGGFGFEVVGYLPDGRGHGEGHGRFLFRPGEVGSRADFRIIPSSSAAALSDSAGSSRTQNSAVPIQDRRSFEFRRCPSALLAERLLCRLLLTGGAGALRGSAS